MVDVHITIKIRIIFKDLIRFLIDSLLKLLIFLHGKPHAVHVHAIQVPIVPGIVRGCVATLVCVCIGTSIVWPIIAIKMRHLIVVARAHLVRDVHANMLATVWIYVSICDVYLAPLS